MVGLIRRDDRGEGSEREVDTGERHQVGLELVQINVQGSIETKRGSDRGNDYTTRRLARATFEERAPKGILTYPGRSGGSGSQG